MQVNNKNNKVQPWKSLFLANFSSLFGSNPKMVKLCSDVLDQFHNVVKHHGLTMAIRYFKELERHTRMCMLGQVSVLKLPIWTKLRKGNGLPLYFKDLKIFELEDQYCSAVLTALGYYRLYNLSPDESVISRITDGPSHSIPIDLLDDIESFSRTFFRERGINQYQLVDSLPFYATTKAGAHGASAMGVTSISDAKSVDQLSIRVILEKVLPQIYTPKFVKEFWDVFDKSLNQFKFSFKYRPFTSRIHLLAEAGGKTRAICIPDIWTQSALKPIHQYLMNVLKRMPNDGTFSHSALAEKVKAFTNRHSLFCYDLTAATDRFPLEVQKRVLKPLLGDLVEGWSDLISERDFKYKDKLIRYGVGQPMGMLSSWAAFTISHHVIINYAKKDKSFYAVIGDDMVLHKRRAAEKYLELLRIFGVEYSAEKSLTPSNICNSAEIAKRYFRNGIEISPIPPRVLLESTKNLEGFLEFLEVLASRTNRFRGFPGLDWSVALSTLWKHNVDCDNELAQVVLTCPINGYFPFLDNNQDGLKLLSELSDRWDRSKILLITRLLERFVLDEAVRQLNDNKLVLKLSGLPLGRPASAITVSPIVEAYLQQKLQVLSKQIKLYIGTYVDEEGDSFEPSAPQLLEFLLSEPDPLSPQDFLEKRKIRRKRGLGLIQKFWTENKRMISPQIPLVPKPN